MNVAIIHYHLRSGGVSSVLRAQAEALSQFAPNDRIVILSGTEPSVSLPVPVFVVPELDYIGRAVQAPAGAAGMLADGVELALDEAFPEGSDLLHIHNPLIRKNGAFLEALSLLQRRGHRLLVQVHDFAEDFRPDVYHNHAEYPGACVYAAINSRDRDHLADSGLDRRHVHLLPNSVTLPTSFAAREGFAREAGRGRRTALYPVRGIRRKNLGEALLLSRFLPEGAELAVTLPPTSERDMPTYAAWKSLASELALPLRFEAGLTAQLSALYNSSFCVVTTSVKEGFGYAYLDPIARGIPVVGREISHVVADFRGNGIPLPGLYREIRIPRDMVPEASLREAVLRRLDSFRNAFTPTFAEAGPGGLEQLEVLLRGLAQRFEAEYLDFGALDENLQAGLLRRLETEGTLDRELRALNPFLATLFEVALSSRETEAQRQALAMHYSAEAYALQLTEAYRDGISDRVDGQIDRRRLLARYLVPESFFLGAS